jgi:glycyl-tRNA synthetase beta chain
MSKLLLEIFTEEIPYGLQEKAQQDIKTIWEAVLQKYQIEYKSIKIYSTPRRLVTLIEGLPEKTPDIKEEKKGPSISANKEVIEGFLRSNNIKIEECEVRKIEKGEFYFIVKTQPGKLLEEALPRIIEAEVLGQIKFKKSMRYNDSGIQWARPIRRLTAILENNNTTQFLNINFGGIGSSNIIDTHRFLGQQNILVKNISDYFKALEENFVILDAEKRKEIIVSKAKEIADKYGLVIHENETMFAELAYLVEHVEILVGEIPEKYMELPKEMLILIIAKNQRYINLLNKDGSLSNKFIIISNQKATDGGKEIILGNKKVLEARLEDGLFFYKNDIKQPLLNKGSDLKKVTFFEGLGSVFDKKERIKELFKFVFNENQDLLCDLCKNDITTSVVVEMPELQGIMGYYYAINSGVNSDISKAIAEHYKPVGLADGLPSSLLGAKLSILDKLDTLISLFKIGKMPTGSKDPYALRRSALGIIRLIIEFNISINFANFLSQNLLDFLKERLYFYTKESFDVGIVKNCIDNNKNFNILEIYHNITSFSAVIKSESGLQVLQMFKRIQNIYKVYSNLQIENINESLFEDKSEVALYSNFIKIKNQVNISSKEQSIKDILQLKVLIDNFLEQVAINQSPNDLVKMNRVSLLKNILIFLNTILPFEDILR